MAKGNLFWSKARGKLGDLVLTVENGEQITRSRNRHPRNPRTAGQLDTRVKFVGSQIFYRNNKNFFPFAFNYKKANESEFNGFVKANFDVGPYVQRNLRNKYAALAPYTMTEGDLYPINVTEVSEVDNGSVILTTDLRLSRANWKSLFETIGQRVGSMITVAVFGSNVYSLNDGRKNTQNIYQHVYTGDEEDFTIEGLTISVENGVLKMALNDDTLPSYVSRVAACIVVSENLGGVKVSTSKLCLNPLAQQDYNYLRSDSAYQTAITSYGEVKDVLLDPNQANNGVAAPYFRWVLDGGKMLLMDDGRIIVCYESNMELTTENFVVTPVGETTAPASIALQENVHIAGSVYKPKALIIYLPSNAEDYEGAYNIKVTYNDFTLTEELEF